MERFQNVFVYVSDALRYDHFPKSVASEQDLVPTLAPAGYTPISFSSMLTGLQPSNHNVRSFYDTLSKSTVLREFENGSFFGHSDGAMCRNVLRRIPRKDLPDVEPPFFHVERALDTHGPYGKVGHGNEVPSNPQLEGSLHERYKKGVDSTAKHFLSHVEELEERDLLKDTLVIFTSDHGELLGERKVLRERRFHNKPLCKELCVVPTLFYNHNVDFEAMRAIDIAPTAAALTGNNFETDGSDLTRESTGRAETMLQINTSPLLTASTYWTRDGKNWQRDMLTGAVTDLATIGIDLINPLRKRLRNRPLIKRLRNAEAAKGGMVKEDSEIEDIDV